MRASNEPATPDGAATTTTAPLKLPAPTGRDALWALLGGLGGMVVGLLVGLVPALLCGGLPFAAVGLATSALGGLAGLWLALVRRRGWGWRELGFTTCTPSAWNLLWEVPVSLVAALACTATIGLALGITPQPATEQDLITDTITAAPWSLALGGLCIVLLVPVVEEVVFRRVLLGWLRTRVPAGVAVVVASAGFAAAHLAPVLMVYTFFVGLAAALLFLRHRSLWASLALHVTNNAIATLLAAAALTS